MFPVAILAGGLATRLGPLTARVPKALIDINGEPFAIHQLRLLKSRGIERVVFCIGHLGHMIRDAVGDGSRYGLRVSYSEDGSALRGTGGAVARALPELSERFFVLYGDSYLPCDYSAVGRAFLNAGKDGLMTVYRNEGKWDTSNVCFENGKIIAYDKTHKTPGMDYIDYGLGVFDRRAFAGRAEDEVFDLAEVYRDLLAGGRLAGYEIGERFYEIGSASGIQTLQGYLTEVTA
jgi:NDP-sugar pyrophosphorylase family protein